LRTRKIQHQDSGGEKKKKKNQGGFLNLQAHKKTPEGNKNPD
jgi:hypothetical protein